MTTVTVIYYHNLFLLSIELFKNSEHFFGTYETKNHGSDSEFGSREKLFNFVILVFCFTGRFEILLFNNFFFLIQLS